MKTLALDNALKNFDGKEILDAATGQALTLREVLLQHVGGYRAADGKSAVMAYRIGLRIYEAGASLEIEDAEFDLLKKALAEPKFTALVMGQVFGMIE